MIDVNQVVHSFLVPVRCKDKHELLSIRDEITAAFTKLFPHCDERINISTLAGTEPRKTTFVINGTKLYDKEAAAFLAEYMTARLQKRVYTIDAAATDIEVDLFPPDTKNTTIDAPAVIIREPYAKYISATFAPELTMATAIRTCYSKVDPKDMFDTYMKKMKLDPQATLKQITDLYTGCMDSGHHSVFEHFNVTFAVGGSRAMSHQLVRHRIASFCLAPETDIPSFTILKGIITKNHTLLELYHMQTEHPEAFKRTMVRSVDKDGLFGPNRIKQVVKSGIRKLYKVTTKGGHSVSVTMKHRFLLPGTKYKPLSALKIGERVCTEGEKVSEKVFYDEIVSIEFDREDETYDMEMVHAPRNFVANGFVVHNSQQSQRYIEADEFPVVVPRTLKTTKQIVEYLMFMEAQIQEYKRMIADGVNKEDARFVFGNGAFTQLVVTMNVRSLMNFFAHRCCRCTQWELRQIAEQLLEQLREEFPVVFCHPYMGAKCRRLGYCEEKPNRTCGRYPLRDEVLGSNV